MYGGNYMRKMPGKQTTEPDPRYTPFQVVWNSDLKAKYLLFFNLKSEFWDPGLLTLPFQTCSSGSQDCLDVSFGFRLQSMKIDSANEFI